MHFRFQESPDVPASRTTFCWQSPHFVLPPVLPCHPESSSLWADSFSLLHLGPESQFCPEHDIPLLFRVELGFFSGSAFTTVAQVQDWPNAQQHPSAICSLLPTREYCSELGVNLASDAIVCASVMLFCRLGPTIQSSGRRRERSGRMCLTEA
ncbi:unnamed protein product [Protopolystoma xenopodis]|uniref:Uncharacterized protein n=1 Tax=Protopolystoma xenopodis TaxID=117903 RepID=A0A3S5C3E2_9PLAT|nr:unnamed protein product [Protopolystoma xenopodis]